MPSSPEAYPWRDQKPVHANSSSSSTKNQDAHEARGVVKKPFLGKKSHGRVKKEKKSRHPRCFVRISVQPTARRTLSPSPHGSCSFNVVQWQWHTALAHGPQSSTSPLRRRVVHWHTARAHGPRGVAFGSRTPSGSATRAATRARPSAINFLTSRVSGVGLVCAWRVCAAASRREVIDGSSLGVRRGNKQKRTSRRKIR